MEWTTVYATSLRGNAVHSFYEKRGLIHVSDYLHACHEFSIIIPSNISQFCLYPAICINMQFFGQSFQN